MLHKLVVIWMKILLTFLLALTWLLADLKTSFLLPLEMLQKLQM